MYGEGRNLRYFIGLGLVIVLLFVVIFMIIRGGGDDGKVPETERELTSYTDDSNAAIVFTTIGPITAPENHNEVQIVVTNTDASIDVMQGFDGNVLNSQTYPLTTSAFGEFLHALNRAGYTEGNTAEDLKDDRGFCPTGSRYIFEVRDGSKTVQRFWSTNCRNTPKTFKGNESLAIDLFRAQIPNYDELTTDVNID
ncbi:MAG TPA: hypothetical protein VGE30_00590 [Candidatus Saccharimonadales bacterium]